MTARGYAGRLAAAFILYIMAILVAVLFLPAFARAHDAPSGWAYPIECCSGMDCAPVDQMTIMPDRSWMVTTKHGQARVPPEMSRRDSKDNKTHACIRRSWDGEYKVICVFVPAAT